MNMASVRDLTPQILRFPSLPSARLLRRVLLRMRPLDLAELLNGPTARTSKVGRGSRL
jgi:hypothetical protein